MRRQRNFIGPQGMSGMVSLWGASSLVQSIQRGSITIAAANASNTATITSVDITRSRLRILGYSNNNAVAAPASSSIRLALTNATTVTATRITTGASDAVVDYEIIEYLPGVVRSIQRGIITLLSATSVTATVTSVNTAKTELDFLGCTVTANVDTCFARLSLTNATTVTANRSSGAANETVVGYQVVEWF